MGNSWPVTEGRVKALEQQVQSLERIVLSSSSDEKAVIPARTPPAPRLAATGTAVAGFIRFSKHLKLAQEVAYQLRSLTAINVHLLPSLDSTSGDDKSEFTVDLSASASAGNQRALFFHFVTDGPCGRIDDGLVAAAMKNVQRSCGEMKAARPAIGVVFVCYGDHDGFKQIELLPETKSVAGFGVTVVFDRETHGLLAGRSNEDALGSLAAWLLAPRSAVTSDS